MTMTPRDPVNVPGYEAQRRLGPTRLGVLKSWEWHDDPRRLLFSMARYKLVAKMLEGRRRVLELGCGDGFLAPIVRQTVGELTITDFDPLFVADAEERIPERWPYRARVLDILEDDVPDGPYDGIYCLDLLEHLPAERDDDVIGKICGALAPEGVAIVGMPSLESQVHASAPSRAGHVNCKSAPQLRTLMERWFHAVFMLSMNDEVVHTGFHGMAHYIVALCAHKKARSA